MTDKAVQKAIASRIKELRERLGLSQEEVAKQVKLSRTAISQIENSERCVSGMELADFSRLFKVSTDYILGLEKELEVILPKDNKHTSKQSMRISVPQIKLD